MFFNISYLNIISFINNFLNYIIIIFFVINKYFNILIYRLIIIKIELYTNFLYLLRGRFVIKFINIFYYNLINSGNVFNLL